MCARTLVLRCALVVAMITCAAAYTVDCNHEYTDCDTELSKITGEEDDVLAHNKSPPGETTTIRVLKELKMNILPSTMASIRVKTATENRTETERDLERRQDSERGRETERVRERERERGQERERERDRERGPEREHERQREREREREPEREREREREREPEQEHEPEPKALSDVQETTETSTTPEIKPMPRQLNLNVDELQNFAIALHNESSVKSEKKHLPDLSDVNLDVDDEEEPRMVAEEHKHKDLPEKFYANLQAPFHPLMNVERGSEEMDTCKENEITYKLGERMDRGCDETCECSAGGIFDCTPRCKHPYIRRGRRLNDPLCFESPVDECCSIIACATGNDMKAPKLEMCRYGNETHTVGSKWYIGCEQICTCDRNSIVTCKPRCNPLPQSDKCINVQDPNDACCEVQVCDVSHDVHEEPDNSTSSTTNSSSKTSNSTPSATSTSISFASTYSTEKVPRSFEEFELQTDEMPLAETEPIGSVKVLQNNSVQVNLMQFNQSEEPIHLLLSNDGGKTFSDVELKYSNLILNLEGGKDYILKTKETGTKFNFTITASDNGLNEVPNDDVHNISKLGCYQDGQFYAVGDEFHIGCTELCECTGPDTRECAALVCPSQVGLELVSKGCVRWAPSPPASPPNCCPRSARCLSDGTCHYKGIAVPNWSEVPISLTGCEQRCFCENGDLDCQEVCSPLPPVPPQNFRCPPNHRPAAVNISDEDCCKQWGCVPNAGNGSSYQTYSMPVLGEVINYVTPVAPDISTSAPVIPTPPLSTDSVDFYRHLSPVKSLPKYIKTVFPPTNGVEAQTSPSQTKGDNITVFTLDDIDSPFKTIHPEQDIIGSRENWEVERRKPEQPKLADPFRKTLTNFNQAPNSHPEKQVNLIDPDNKIGDFYQRPAPLNQRPVPQSVEGKKFLMKSVYEPVRKVPISKIDNLKYFLPSVERRPLSESYSKNRIDNKPLIKPELLKNGQNMFEPIVNITNVEYHIPRVIHPQTNIREPPPFRKHVTILKTKDMKGPKPTEMYHDALWNDGTKARHVLTKDPNPYETVLLRPVSNPKPDVPSTYNAKATHMSIKPYAALDLERLLNQMEVESVVNKNLGRSADRAPEDVAGQQTPNGPSQQTFLPTIPPEIHFPQEDNLADYDINNVHRPGNPVEPAVNGLPPGLTLPSYGGDSNKKLSVISLQADSPTSVKMLFGLPSVLVGLRGSVDLRYTDKADEEVSHWYSQVFAPADEVLTTPRLEFRLTGLKPSTTYKIRGKLYLHNLPVEPESDIYTVRTQDDPTPAPVEEKRRDIDSHLTAVEVNDTTAQVSWRRFTEDELQLIDAIQVRYRPMGTPIYSMTELLHHSRSAAELHDLRPGVRYEASLVFIPPPKATTELVDLNRIEFETAPYVDPYNWTVTIEARSVGSDATEVWWHGIPAPAERWVRVYRGAHACGNRREKDAFRLATRDLPPAITLSGLQPNTKCRVWLELFLTNGKVKTSNVLEINTKSVDSADPIDNEIEASSVASHHRGDYYGALVGVGTVAALGALTSLLLLLVVLRRHRPRSVPITTVPSAPRESSLPPYDNPAYKLELQQETMDL